MLGVLLGETLLVPVTPARRGAAQPRCGLVFKSTEWQPILQTLGTLACGGGERRQHDGWGGLLGARQHLQHTSTDSRRRGSIEIALVGNPIFGSGRCPHQHFVLLPSLHDLWLVC